MTKKEVQRLVGEKDKLSSVIEGIKNMGGLPDALFVIDVGHEKIAIQEAKRLSIPVVGIVDTNNNPTIVDFPIPGNDDALRAIRFYCKVLADEVIQARGVLELVAEKPEETQPVKTKVKVKKVVKKKAGEEAELEVAAEPDTESLEPLESEQGEEGVEKPKKPVRKRAAKNTDEKIGE